MGRRQTDVARFAESRDLTRDVKTREYQGEDNPRNPPGSKPAASEAGVGLRIRRHLTSPPIPPRPPPPSPDPTGRERGLGGEGFSHRLTLSGCMVSCTTSTSRAVSLSKSVSSRQVAPNSAITFAASYFLR